MRRDERSEPQADDDADQTARLQHGAAPVAPEHGEHQQEPEDQIQDGHPPMVAPRLRDTASHPSGVKLRTLDL